MKKLNSKGFTLVEITVVISMLAILAAIGVGKFTALKRKQKNAQAKYLLGVLHSRMTNFQTEWGGYWGRFRDIGFNPTGTLIYDVGFRGAEGPVPGGGDFIPVGGANEINTRAACGNDLDSCSVALAPVLSVGGTWTANTFLAGAEGNLGGSRTDQWTINQLKDQLLHVRDGSL